jgi:four helix bundle protein
MIRSVWDLRVYRLAFKLASEIFQLTRKFPKEERYSLTDQIVRSSRSVAINIREGFAKRRYENVFIRHLIDSVGSSEETRGWLEFALDCKYITKAERDYFDTEYDKVNGMLYNLTYRWKTYKDEDRRLEREGRNRGQKTEDRKQKKSDR